MTDTPRISIITPTRNRKQSLVRAIESVRGQSFEDFEHIVVDDGSTDGTAEAMASTTDLRLRFVRLDRWRGANAARNFGIGLAKAPIITFLDSDDVFLPFRLERSLALFESNPELELAISAFGTSKTGAVSGKANSSVQFDAEMLERAVAAQVTAIAGSAITVRKAAIVSAGLFDEELWRLQDRDLLLRLARNGYGAAVLETTDWIKHNSPDSISRQRGGYVSAYGELLHRHPQIRKRYPDLIVYMVARRLLNHVLQGHVREALTEYKINRESPVLGFSPAALCTGYITGRRQRRQVAREVQALKSAPATPGDLQTQPPDSVRVSAGRS